MHNLNLRMYNQMLTRFVTIFILQFTIQIQTRSDRVTIQVDERYSDEVLQGLGEFNFSVLFKITPAVYIFEYKGDLNTDRAIQLVRNEFQHQIIEIEPLRVYEYTFKPVPTVLDEAGVNMTTLLCSRFYRMSVPQVWERNITGKDVTIAVTDLGTDTHPMDLKQNTSVELCKNVLINDSYVTPEHFLEVIEEESSFQDHGNNDTSRTGVIKDIDICGARIAYDATLVGITIHTAEIMKHQFSGPPHKKRTMSKVRSRTFADELDNVDICIQAWAPTRPFDHLDFVSRSFIEYGFTLGRKELGTIFVVPTGSCGNELSNNIYTISVNSIGTQPSRAIMDASVLISGFRDENNSTAMVTSSYDTQCVTTFRRHSAAVSQVAGIIALGLQANPKLTLRDVQHLLVDAAEHEHLGDTIAFKTNGAFRHFNNIFGFGLLNADKFVKSAQMHKPVPRLRSWTLPVGKLRVSRAQTHIYEFCYSCDVYRDPSCLIFVEHVTATDERPFSKNGSLVSVHFWDEVAFGRWYIKVQSKHSWKTQVHNISLTLYGTRHASKVHLAASFMTSCGGEYAWDKGQQKVVPSTSSPKSKGSEVTSTFTNLNILLISTGVLSIFVIFCTGKWCHRKIRFIFDNFSRHARSSTEVPLVTENNKNDLMSNYTSKRVKRNLSISGKDKHCQKQLRVDTKV